MAVNPKSLGLTGGLLLDRLMEVIMSAEQEHFYANGKVAFSVNTDGTITLPAGSTLDEASLAFWTAVVAKGPAARIAELEALLEQRTVEKVAQDMGNYGMGAVYVSPSGEIKHVRPIDFYADGTPRASLEGKND